LAQDKTTPRFRFHAVHFDVVIVSGPLAGADCRVLARFQEFFFDRVQREILIALDNDRGVALAMTLTSQDALTICDSLQPM